MLTEIYTKYYNHQELDVLCDIMASGASIVAGVIVLIIIIALAAYALSTAGPAKSAYTSSASSYSSAATSPGTTANPASSTSAPASSASSNTTTITTSSNAISNTNSSVKVGYSASVGNYLTDWAGYTLYIFTNDTPDSGKSTCNGFCAGIWPAFYATNVSAPGLDSSAFSTITRANGSMQLAYYGRPLYLYSGDSSPGQMNGLGLFGMWYPISPTGNVIT